MGFPIGPASLTGFSLRHASASAGDGAVQFAAAMNRSARASANADGDAEQSPESMIAALKSPRDLRKRRVPWPRGGPAPADRRPY